MDRMTTAPIAARRREPRRRRPSSSLDARARSSAQVYMDEKIKDYIVDVVFATREPSAARAARTSPTSSSTAPARARRSR